MCRRGNAREAISRSGTSGTSLAPGRGTAASGGTSVPRAGDPAWPPWKTRAELVSVWRNLGRETRAAEPAPQRAAEVAVLHLTARIRGVEEGPLPQAARRRGRGTQCTIDQCSRRRIRLLSSTSSAGKKRSAASSASTFSWGKRIMKAGRVGSRSRTHSWESGSTGLRFPKV